MSPRFFPAFFDHPENIRYIVASAHLVDIDFLNLLFRQVTGIKLQDAGSVRTKIGGIFGLYFVTGPY